MNETEKPDLRVIECSGKDLPVVDAGDIDPALQDYEIRVSVKGSVLKEALTDKEKWRMLWTKMIPELLQQNARVLKATVLNGFKEPKTNEELMECRNRMLEMENPVPKIHVVQSLPPGFKNRANRRKK